MRVTPVLVVLASAAVLAQSKNEPPVAEVMARVGAYVAAYGEKTSVVVAKETYTQNVGRGAAPILRRQLVAEFAIVRADRGWTGFRDVVEVDGKPVRDRHNRLLSLLTSQSPTMSEATRIANESARYNIGPVARNFNTPTATMFFFLPDNLSRFEFSRKGTKTIGGVRALEIGFKETRSPTFVMTRAGNDVPVEGSLWVDPANGTVMRTRMRLRNFADTETAPDLPAGPPPERPAVNPNVPTAGRAGVGRNAALPDASVRPVESRADFDVTYQRPEGIDLWLPVEMVEVYSGPIVIRNRPVSVGATTRATYSDFQQFSTTITIVPQSWPWSR